jgi:arylsulfatase
VQRDDHGATGGCVVGNEFLLDEYSADERRVFTRLQAAFAGMLDHADQHLARLIGFLDTAGIRDNTLVLVLSDNGASQEGGPWGFVNAMGPYNFRPEPLAEKLRRIDDIGGPDSHSNFPHGWAMASNTPLRRYKQNTHGGGIRDPFVMTWPKKIAAISRTKPIADISPMRCGRRKRP